MSASFVFIGMIILIFIAVALSVLAFAFRKFIFSIMATLLWVVIAIQILVNSQLYAFTGLALFAILFAMVMAASPFMYRIKEEKPAVVTKSRRELYNESLESLRKARRSR